MADDMDYALAISLQEHFDKDVSKRTPDDSEEIICVKEVKNIDNGEFKLHYDEDFDYAIALSLQEDRVESVSDVYDQPTLSKDNYDRIWDPKSVVDESWELVDPNPNIHNLFIQFDAMFFKSTLTNAGVAVQWSPRMTLCAGVCCYEGRGGLCCIRLSEPLLKLRPRKDLVETLLHEMIHALLFVTANNKDRDGHGPEFLSHMNRINKMTGANITVYHSFHDEVNLYRQHWWKCNGPCQHRPPFYGMVRRATNRAPSSSDRWWSDHQRDCSGTFIKIKEPDGYSNKNKSKAKKTKEVTPSQDIRKMLTKKVPSKESETKDSQTTIDNFVGNKRTHSIDLIEPLSETIEEKRCKFANAAEKRIQALQNRGLCKKTPNKESTTRDRINIVTDDNKQGSLKPILDSPHNNRVGPSYSSHNSSHNIVCNNEAITIDDDDDIVISSVSSSRISVSEKRTCPVCGRDDIPFTTINTHIAFCVEEMELEDENDN